MIRPSPSVSRRQQDHDLHGGLGIVVMFDRFWLRLNVRRAHGGGYTGGPGHRAKIIVAGITGPYNTPISSLEKGENMGLLNRLYQGDIRPGDQIGSAPGPYQDARGELYRRCEALEAKLPVDLWPELERLVDAAGDALVAGEEAAFSAGARLAGKILIEILR